MFVILFKGKRLYICILSEDALSTFHWLPCQQFWGSAHQVHCNSSTLIKCLPWSLKSWNAHGFCQPIYNLVSTLLIIYLFSSKTFQNPQNVANNCSGTGRNCENRFLLRTHSDLTINAFYFYRIIINSRYVVTLENAKLGIAKLSHKHREQILHSFCCISLLLACFLHFLPFQSHRS